MGSAAAAAGAGAGVGAVRHRLVRHQREGGDLHHRHRRAVDQLLRRLRRRPRGRPRLSRAGRCLRPGRALVEAGQDHPARCIGRDSRRSPYRAGAGLDGGGGGRDVRHPRVGAADDAGVVAARHRRRAGRHGDHRRAVRAHRRALRADPRSGAGMATVSAIWPLLMAAGRRFSPVFPRRCRSIPSPASSARREWANRRCCG